ncbi:RNA polymerase [Pseudomonas phage vB_PaeM_VL12]|uniref:RNA polymerase n=12 Tax=Nankokuvirus TaxID=1925779 RepID=A0A0K0L9G6_9CAUD|nr:hypothetical protein [Pseudomonas aeruginosa]YP_004306757.1 putative RNA polymerase [Pseudomonas phage KPP10]YP_008856884.1 hypothetical protein X832_gp008 [Pseudomonas phage PAK_P5]YP_008857643.1 hypothetical protein PAK_P30008 [Pseudomonas phage PAK_P3]YP_008858031.1 hypothetical protein X837_gp008 [Pseudomonas phage CHA_P1]YP_009206022.1 hypothetical protein AVT15_gp144 [Pseudomonas phage vB_PaeM_PS24]YP_009604685.1 putative RNA polymerase [Pseudomonas phage vB_PaeM_G1]ADX32004.1 hypot
MPSRISADFRKLDALIARMEALDGLTLEGGFFPEDRYGPENGNLPVAQVAAYNVFGTETNPERDFMTPSFSDWATVNYYRKAMKQVVEATIRDGRTQKGQLNKMGRTMVEIIQVNIDDFPGHNSARWAQVKGFDDPLTHTGKMQDSVKYKIVRRK